MLTKDAAETTGTVGEAPTLVVVLCLYLAASVVLPTIAQTLLEFGIKCFFAFPDRCQFDNCSFQSSSLPSINFLQTCLFKCFCSIERPQPAEWKQHHLRFWNRLVGWSAQRYSVKGQFFPARRLLKGNQLIVLHLSFAFLLQEVGFDDEMEELQKDPCDARASVYLGTP